MLPRLRPHCKHSPTMIIVEPADPRTDQATALLKKSHALMEELFPAEDNHFLDIETLCGDDIHFFIARIAENVCGTGALAIRGDYGEVKSMFVDEAARGKGVAAAILRQLEDTAREFSLQDLKLETGNVLYAAQKLYRSHGFADCGPFGAYKASESSVFMAKSIVTGSSPCTF